MVIRREINCLGNQVQGVGILNMMESGRGNTLNSINEGLFEV